MNSSKVNGITLEHYDHVAAGIGKDGCIDALALIKELLL